MKLIKDTISISELQEMSKKMFNNLVKAVVDIDQNVMAVDAELHSDLEEFLLEATEAQQDNVWGINLHPDKLPHEDWIEFDSMINIRPSLANAGRYVYDPLIRKKIVTLVNTLVKP